MNKGFEEMDKISGDSNQGTSSKTETSENIPDNRLADYISTKCEPIIKTDQDDNEDENN